jgi:hypothetical protein
MKGEVNLVRDKMPYLRKELGNSGLVHQKGMIEVGIVGRHGR